MRWMVDLGGCFQVLIFFRKAAPILETKYMERCYMHDLLTQGSSDQTLVFKIMVGTCFAPVLRDVLNHPIEFGKISMD